MSFLSTSCCAEMRWDFFISSFLFNTVLLLYHVNAQVNIPSTYLLLAEPETLVLIGHNLGDVTGGESYLCPVCAGAVSWPLLLAVTRLSFTAPRTGPNPHLDNLRILIVTWISSEFADLNRSIFFQNNFINPVSSQCSRWQDFSQWPVQHYERYGAEFKWDMLSLLLPSLPFQNSCQTRISSARTHIFFWG